MELHKAFESDNKKKVRSHFKNLLAVAMADGILDKVELDNLFKISKKYYITREELESLVDDSSNVMFNPPASKEERCTQLYNLVQMMLVDGEVDSNEFRMCMSYGVGLGFEPATIEETIQQIIALIESGKDREDVIEQMMSWKN